MLTAFAARARPTCGRLPPRGHDDPGEKPPQLAGPPVREGINKHIDGWNISFPRICITSSREPPLAARKDLLQVGPGR